MRARLGAERTARSKHCIQPLARGRAIPLAPPGPPSTAAAVCSVHLLLFPGLSQGVCVGLCALKPPPTSERQQKLGKHPALLSHRTIIPR